MWIIWFNGTLISSLVSCIDVRWIFSIDCSIEWPKSCLKIYSMFSSDSRFFSKYFQIIPLFSKDLFSLWNYIKIHDDVFRSDPTENKLFCIIMNRQMWEISKGTPQIHVRISREIKVSMNILESCEYISTALAELSLKIFSDESNCIIAGISTL